MKISKCEICNKEIYDYEIELSQTRVSHDLCEKHQEEVMNFLIQHVKDRSLEEGVTK